MKLGIAIICILMLISSRSLLSSTITSEIPCVEVTLDDNSSSYINFTIVGTSPKNILIIADGSPPFDPNLTITDNSGNIVAYNDDWTTASNVNLIKAYGNTGSLDSLASGVLVSLKPGTYKAVVNGANGTKGSAILLFYDYDAYYPQTSYYQTYNYRAGMSLINYFSVTNTSGVGANFMFQVPNSTDVIIRGLGTSLGSLGITKPQVNLYNYSNGKTLADNTNWNTNAAAISQASQLAGLPLLTTLSGDAAVLFSSSSINSIYQNNATFLANSGSGSLCKLEITVLPNGTIATLPQPPTITTNPTATISLALNASLKLTSAATPSNPNDNLTYQWYLNSVAIPNATSAIYSVPSVQAKDSGTYYAIVSENGATALTSNSIVTVQTPPFITTQPQGSTINSGSNITFAVSAVGATPYTYQWYLNNFPITGATSSSLTINSVNAINSGSYTVVVSNSYGPTSSIPAILNVIIPPAITTQALSQNIVVGASATLSIVNSGSASSYQWYKDGTPITGATTATLIFKSTNFSDSGNYTVTVTNGAGSVVSNPAQLTVINPGRLVNLSVLSMDGPGNQLLTVGFVTGGSGTYGSQNLLIRGSGPALSAYNVSPVLPDPMLNVYSGQSVVISNDNWGNTIANVTAVSNAEATTGAFVLTSSTSLDSAVVANLQSLSNGYTVQISGKGSATGMALAEIYDNTPAGSYVFSTPRLVNISCLEQVNKGGILTAGFVIGGNTPLKVLIRASGPSLASFGISGYLLDPVLTVFNNSTPIASNNGWAGNTIISSASSLTGAFPFISSLSKDSAIVLSLQPGAYSAQVASDSGTIGITLIEVYEVPNN